MEKVLLLCLIVSGCGFNISNELYNNPPIINKKQWCLDSSRTAYELQNCLDIPEIIKILEDYQNIPK